MWLGNAIHLIHGYAISQSGRLGYGKSLPTPYYRTRELPPFLVRLELYHRSVSPNLWTVETLPPLKLVFLL